MLDNLSEDMTEEEIKEAEKDIESLKNMLKGLSEWQGDWEKFGIDITQIDSSASADIGIAGEEAFLEGRGDKLVQFKRELKEAEEMVKKSKEKLEKKKSDEEKEMCGKCCGPYFFANF